MYGFIPSNQFNIDVCLDTFSVLNRTMKVGCSGTPYELFTGDKVDQNRDFRCRWGELVIVKKPKGIASDLRTTGEWAMVVRRSMNHTGVLKVYLIGTRRYAYRLKFVRNTVPEWVITAMNSIGDRAIGFEDDNEGDLTPKTRPIAQDTEADIEDHGDEEGPLADELLEHIEQAEVDDINEALRIIDDTALEDAFEEEREGAHIETRARTDPQRFQMEQDAERYAEYVAMGWREPEAQDIGKVVFNRAFKRTEGNLIKAREILRKSYLSRHAAEHVGGEMANVYFDEAMKDKPEAAWEALL